MTKTCTNLQIPCYSITGNFLNIAPFGPCRPCRPCQWFFPKAESKQKWPLSLAARPAMWEGPLPQKTLNKVDLDINDINLWLRLDTQGLPMPYCKIRSNTDYHSTYYLSINMIYLYLSILIIYVVYFLSDPMSWNWWTLELGIAHHAWQQSPSDQVRHFWHLTWGRLSSSPGAFGPAEATTWRSSGLEMGAIYGNLIDLTLIWPEKMRRSPGSLINFRILR